MMSFAYGCSALFGALGIISLLAGSEEPRLVRKVFVSLCLLAAGCGGLAMQAWRLM